MAEVITLPAGQLGMIVLEERPGIGWFSCTLRLGEIERELGANGRTYLLSHLRHVTEKSDAHDGEVEGKPVRWILSLAEKHSCLYVHDGPNGEKTLYWEDRNADVIWSDRLSADQLSEWRRVIDASLRGESRLA